ncbi:MAG: hypothetical protein BZY88_15830 [SAR202 cluster bacterium Io17-Chloro-G9]|nr:MAG: hypothetical protein BZY88_15830 [SAR202 cluster bacterium Io17-Chloro-G9]
MPNKEIVTCEALGPVRGLLSQATRFGDLVFVQGCTGRNPTTGEVGKDIREQTRYTLERIKLILEAAGTSLDNVMTNTCYVTRREDLEGFNEVYGEYFPAGRPARTAIIVNFGAEDNLVEVTSTACIPG